MAEISSMAAPWVRLRFCCQPCPYRVEMDIAHQFEQVAVLVHQDGFVASLEEVTGPFLPPVEPAGIPEREILHGAGQGDFANLQGQMNMVGHEAEGVNPVPKADGSFLKQEVKTAIVGVSQKNILPAVASENNMIESTG